MELGENSIGVLVSKPIPMEMYKVSGFGEPKIDRYLKDKKQDALVMKAAIKNERSEIEDGPMPDHKRMSEEEISEILENGDEDSQKKAVGMISYLPIEKRGELINVVAEKIKKSLGKGNVESHKFAAKIFSLDNQDLKPLFMKNIRKLFDDGFGNEMIKPFLYGKYKNINNENFRREDFKKTGSKLTLIGGPLKDKLIMRTIDPEAFINWQELYENYELWQKNSFDYVPIEPIQSYKLNNEEMVEVFSGVLDLDMSDWNRISGGMFWEELEKQRKNILRVLNTNGFEHDHPHHENFCLRFFRDDKGNPDINRVPRLYLIDFDKATNY